MKKTIIYIAFITFLVASCDIKDKFENEKSPVVDLAGEWWVSYLVAGNDLTGYIPLITHNTANDDGTQLWIDDQENFWTFKVKAMVDAATLSIGSSDTLENDYYPSQVLINNGKVIKGVSLQPSGALADSIYFEVSFSDDGHWELNSPTDSTWIGYETVFQVSGFRRTGFLEDEH